MEGGNPKCSKRDPKCSKEKLNIVRERKRWGGWGEGGKNIARGGVKNIVGEGV